MGTKPQGGNFVCSTHENNTLPPADAENKSVISPLASEPAKNGTPDDVGGRSVYDSEISVLLNCAPGALINQMLIGF